MLYVTSNFEKMKKQLYPTLLTAGILVMISCLYFFSIDPNQEVIANQKNSAMYDHPDRAQLFEARRTMDMELGYAPIERLRDSYEYGKSLISNKRSASEAEWTERGPNNFGGRTRALMFDPNDATRKKVWAAGVTGGIWMNKDITEKNSSWIKVNDFLGSLAVNNIVYDPNDKNTFYCGTGEGWFGGGMVRGNGIYVSDDGGTSWSVLESTQNPEFHYVQKIVVTNESTILAATRSQSGEGGIYRSTDGGASWTEVVTDNRGADIEIVSDKIYATTGIFTEGKLWKSTDDGQTWSDITPESGAERIEIGVHPNHSNVIYAVASSNSDVAWFKRSRDGGATWTNLTIPKYLNSSSCTASNSDFTRGQAWYDLIIGVHPDDADVVIVGGIDLHRSSDGGSSWEPISYWTSACEIYVHADQHNFVFRPDYPDQALASNDGGVFYVEDILVPMTEGGPVFEARNTNYNVTQFYACAARNEVGSNNFLAGAQDNGSHQFTDKGVNETFEVTGGDGAFCFIDQLTGDIQITSYVYNAYYVTTDNWKTYRSFGNGEQGDFINPTDYNSNTKTLFAASGANHLLRYANVHQDGIVEEDLTVDLGAAAISAVTVSPYDDDVVFVGAAGNVFKITDSNGVTPTATKIGGDAFPTGFINNVAVGGSDDHLLVIFSNYGLTSVWETTDGGATWESKEGNLPDMPIRWGLYNPNNLSEVLLATDLGIWATDDVTVSTPEWMPSNAGLANVRCDMIRFRDADGLVIVATHGRGLYTSDVFATEAYADFYVPQVVAYEGESVHFEDVSSKASSHSWNFGDGSTSDQVNPSHSFTAPGEYDVTLTINGDPLTASTQTVRVLSKLNLDFDLAAGGDFESNADLFYAYTKAKTGFSLGNSSIDGKGGTHSGDNCWVLGLDTVVYAPYSEAYLYTPAFDFSLSGAYTLEFYTKYEIEDEWDGFILEYTTDQGTTWKKVGKVLDVENWYNQIAIDQASVFPAGKPFFSGSTNGEFVKKSIDLSFLSNNQMVAFRFVFKSDPAEERAGIAIDDFQIGGPSSSTPSLSFMSDKEKPCINEIVIFSNQSSGAISSYRWDFGLDAVPPSATGYGPHEVVYSTLGTKTITLTGTTESGEVTLDTEVEVGGKPMALAPFSDDTKLCALEAGVITIDNSESGVSYQLYDLKSKILIGDPIVGNGQSIDLVTEELGVGSHEFQVWASIEGGCNIVLTPSIIFSAIKTPEVVIKVSNYNLTSSYKGADSYTWYLDDQVIDGATGEALIADESGTYKVEIVRTGCVVLSEGVEIEILGLSADLHGLNVYPNPVKDLLSVRVSKNSDYQLVLFDAAGRVHYKQSVSGNDDVLEIDMGSLMTGIYYLKVSSSEGSSVKKIKKL